MNRITASFDDCAKCILNREYSGSKVRIVNHLIQGSSFSKVDLRKWCSSGFTAGDPPTGTVPKTQGRRMVSLLGSDTRHQGQSKGSNVLEFNAEIPNTRPWLNCITVRRFLVKMPRADAR